MTTNKTKPCTQWKRHRWEHQYNVQITRINGRSGSISVRGLYRCACGEKKYGEPRHDNR